MTPFYEAALEASHRAFSLLHNPPATLLHKDCGIGAGGDHSSGIDLACEALFLEALAPFGTIESEESGRVGSGEGTVVLDPLDGSSNALSRFPYYGASAALLDRKGVLTEAFVANLATGECFLLDPATQLPLCGTLDGERFLPVSPPPEPEIGLFEKAYAHPEAVAALSDAGFKFRAPGAVALSLAYASRARFFLYLGELRTYDFAAGLALCRNLEVEVGERHVLVAQDPDTAVALRGVLGEMLVD
ncbi:inositol monophosphatase family protein [Nitratifractor sp.]